MHVLLVNLSIDLTGASRSSLVDSDSTSLPDFDRQLMMGVTSDEIDMLKQTANSAIHDSLLKKIQEIDQVRYLCGQWFGSVCNSWWKPWDSLKVLHISYLCGIIEITLDQFSQIVNFLWVSCIFLALLLCVMNEDCFIICLKC